MRTLSILALAAGLPVFGMSAAAAQSAPQPAGAMPGTNMNAKCSADDPEVVLDKSSKTYTMAPSGKMPRAGRPMKANESGETQANAAVAASTNSAAESTLVSMCKSRAESMGAHMSAGSTNPNNH
jgi:hypothetical protein